jgi:hypothetical protein
MSVLSSLDRCGDNLADLTAHYTAQLLLMDPSADFMKRDRSKSTQPSWANKTHKHTA